MFPWGNAVFLSSESSLASMSVNILFITMDECPLGAYKFRYVRSVIAKLLKTSHNLRAEAQPGGARDENGITAGLN